MLLPMLLGAVGVLALVAGATLVVEAGSALGRRLGLSPLWIGLTVVAVGTSAPELVVSVVASVEGRGELALANVVGSNILNILIVLGATAAIAPIKVGGVTVKRDLGLVAAASVGVFLLAGDGILHRGEGALLLLLLIPYLVHVYRAERRGHLPTPEAPTHFTNLPMPLLAASLLAGIGLLVLGGRLVVDGAVAIALTLGITERVVGLTVVAIGTSLPELATSLVAAWRKQVDVALGNLIGSNLMNLLLVLGSAAAIGSLPVASTLWRVDMLVMIGASFLLLRFASTQRKVSRTEGTILLGAYAAYVALVLA